jgi:glycogen debranching enzyme
MTSVQQLVLKEGEVFIVSDSTGDIQDGSPLGLYYHDMRYLSVLLVRVNGSVPERLTAVGGEVFMLSLQFANAGFRQADGSWVSPETISIRRERVVLGGVHERLTFINYNRMPVSVAVEVELGADFRDMFDVRGFQRDRWGARHAPVLDGTTLRLGYTGLDKLEHHTHIEFSRAPDGATGDVPAATQPVGEEPGIMIPDVEAPATHAIIQAPRARITWHLTLPPQAPVDLAWQVAPEDLGTPLAAVPFQLAADRLRAAYGAWAHGSTDMRTGSDSFSHLLTQAAGDLRILSHRTEIGYFPTAGVPWYAVPFGRDSIITALQALALNPDLAAGTLGVLAAYQGRQDDPWREEQPGKILHELRFGEMARLKMVPHTPYYGAVDATPLYVMLFVEAMRWSGDPALWDRFLPHALAALAWVDQYGDIDGDGFVEYTARDALGGIRNQVWKDSGDSTQFPDGTLAETPIAACEVQGYVYAAKTGLSALLAAHGDTAQAARLAAEAEMLKRRFNESFWMAEAGYYAQGLDRDKRPIPTITSNPGHCLWTGIADTDKAAQVAARLVAPDMVSGWGVRTISDLSPSYNPMSYHNGSIWPHDNSIVIAGLRRYGQREAALTVATQLHQASLFFPHARLPELYCGFARDETGGRGPAEYPVSCSPQAWAAGAPFLILQSLLGLEPALDGTLTITDPWLPVWLPSVTLRHLRVGRHHYRVHMVVRAGTVEVECNEEATEQPVS